MPSVCIQNFGCRANQADGAALAAGLRQAGWRTVSGSDGADWTILNTCTVTAAADAQAREAVRRLRRRHPGGRVLVTGCYAQRAAAELAAMEGVTCVVGNSHKHLIGALLAGAEAREAPPARSRNTAGDRHDPLPKIVTGDILQQTQFLAAPSFAGGERTRPILKVQEGCDSRCSYCVIPSVRGRSRSQPAGRVLEQVQTLVAAGYREVVLSGINLGRWGRDLDGSLRLRHLVRALLEQTRIERLRLSSIEPMDWDDDMIALLAAAARAASPRVARHVHMPLQSGSDAVLRRMRRRYTPRHYAERLRRLHAALPEAAFGADVMVGFPGESEAEFEQTRAFIAAHPFTYLHVFTFSGREGTEAARRRSEGAGWTPVPAEAAAERRRRLLDLIATKHADFLATWIGRRLPVITLARSATARPAEGSWSLSDNFIQVWIDAELPANRMLEVHVTGCGDGHLLAVPATAPSREAAGGSPALPILQESYR